MVLFDLGGVVVRICRTWEEACGRAGVPIREPEVFARAELAEQRRHWVHLHQTGQISCEAFWDGLSRATGGLYAPEEVRLVHLAWTMEDYAGIAELIGELREAGITTGCLSNTNHTHWEILRGGRSAGGVGGTFPASEAIARMHRHFVSHKMRAAKPDPAIYQQAEEALGFVSQLEGKAWGEPRGPGGTGGIVFFDDLPENVEAARARGWNAFVIDHTGDTAGQARRALATLGLIG